MPDEAARHADSVVVGYAERTWPQLLHDFTAGRMRERYTITEDAQAAYLAACHAQGQRIGDIKPIVLHRMGGWTQVFRGQRLS